MGNFVQERVKHRLGRAVPGVVFGNLNAFCLVLACAQAALRFRQPEAPAEEPVPAQLLAGYRVQLLQIHGFAR